MTERRSHDVMRAVVGRGWQTTEEIACRVFEPEGQPVSPTSLSVLLWWLEQRGWLCSRIVLADEPVSTQARDGTSLSWQRVRVWCEARVAAHA